MSRNFRCRISWNLVGFELPESGEVKEYDMLFWNSFFTFAITYCVYVAQTICND